MRAMLLGVPALAALGGMALARAAASDSDAFPHAEHADLFPTCVSCHAGAVAPGESIWPAPSSCASCHDGQIEEEVDWRPRTTPLPGNLAFAHDTHAREVADDGADPVPCASCHSLPDSDRMAVERSVVTSCFSCHEITESHYDAGQECASCHVSLARSTLEPATVAGLPAPASHEREDFAVDHGLAGEAAAVQSCATCHARDFCTQCHVDAPEQPLIQALEPDARSLGIAAVLPEPRSHEQTGFLAGHGTEARLPEASCATCHTAESCTACHQADPGVAATLASAGPGRAPGASPERRPPRTHTAMFTERAHGGEAAAGVTTCAGCHVRQDCLDCHVSTPAARGNFHDDGFLARHPVAAYGRETSCADCHNTAGFCAACHQQSGVVSAGLIDAGFHDAKQAFIVGHGQAARQSLESCVSCHVERDCAQCHSSLGGRRFSPHGPGFNADRMRRSNPEMCTVCHGFDIPD